MLLYSKELAVWYELFSALLQLKLQAWLRKGLQ